jgi:hypothetical protein
MKKVKRYSSIIISSAITETLCFAGGCLGASCLTKVKVPAKFIFAGSLFLTTIDATYRIYKYERKERQNESRKEQEV